jgi:hypothetical protein
VQKATAVGAAHLSLALGRGKNISPEISQEISFLAKFTVYVVSEP